jgi:hypothetical protein
MVVVVAVGKHLDDRQRANAGRAKLAYLRTDEEVSNNWFGPTALSPGCGDP